MNKLIAISLIAAMAAFAACGGGKAKEKQKHRLDSLRIDSTKKVNAADSLAALAKDQQRRDSLRQDSIKKTNKNKKGVHSKHKPASHKQHPQQ